LGVYFVFNFAGAFLDFLHGKIENNLENFENSKIGEV